TLEQAGATVTADVRLQSTLIDPRQDAFLTGLANRVSIPGRDIPTGTGAERAVAQIADVLGIRPDKRPLATATVENVLSTYAGRIAAVFALVEQINGKAGSYGTVPGSTPLPTPSP